MNSLSLTFAAGYQGRAVGTATSANLTTPLGKSVVLTSLTGASKQVYERWETPITLATSGSTTLNLMSGLLNPLQESISGTAAFTMVRDVFIQLATSSPALGTIEVFGGTVGSLWQGPLPGTAALTFRRGQGVAWAVPADQTGWTVNSTAKNIEIRNVGTTAVTVNVFIAGDAG